MASWKRVCTPKEKEGLGVVNLRVQNTALLLKHLVKFYSAADLPWVKLISESYYTSKVPHLIMNKGSFWWRDIIVLADVFRGIAKCTQSSQAQLLSFGMIFGMRILSAQASLICTMWLCIRMNRSRICVPGQWRTLFCSPYQLRHMLNFCS